MAQCVILLRFQYLLNLNLSPMAQEMLISRKERKTRQQPATLLVPADKDIRVIKLEISKEPATPNKDLPFSAWKMPPQMDGYLKSNHKDCL